MADRPRHPDKEIEAAVVHLEGFGWQWKKPGKSAHAWGRMLCPQHDRSGCQVSVWSTPRNAANHARQLRRAGETCAHQTKGGEGEDI
ncbi:MAG: hypothetical protein GC188_11760 [Alphaproteobacteria bacterium]|nr:hypothetical protein [Alphaproteobacteria bacterium]